MRLVKDKVAIYSSGKEMPCGRYSDFQRYLLPDDVKSSLLKVKAFIEEGDCTSALIEAEVGLKSFEDIKSGIPVTSLAFAVIVAKIGDDECNDTTIEGLTRTLETLKTLDITQSDVEESIEYVKKK